MIKGVDCLLNRNGLFIFEEPYLGSMYDKTSYDQIYDEHIFMFSVSSIKKVFKLFNFDLINVLPQKTHGGSMRYVIGRSGVHKINKIVFNMVEGGSLSSMAKSAGLGIIEASTFLLDLKPDLVLIVGDRFEIISIAIASAYMNIPIAHTMGGEVSGSIDESIRHAITKFAHIHFPSNLDSYKRIIKMG